jgi:hypothetical protein
VLAAALAGLPRALAERGWLDEAAAAEPDLTRDTFNGLVAFITPGNDEYSIAQGVSMEGPGGIAAGATPASIDVLDDFVGAPFVGGSTGTTIPVSGGVAQLLNNAALQVNPAASRGAFASPFARLAFEEKGEVFRRLQSDPTLAGSPAGLLAALLPGLIAGVALSDAPVLEGGKTTATPLGWAITGYRGVTDGTKELKGYYRGHRAARDAHRYVLNRHRRRRRSA